ncbi:MAG: phosphohistidine phosphatase [Myxococcales bacterium]|nr:phosphohistidine phosphatase [Myxococcales bacterium]
MDVYLIRHAVAVEHGVWLGDDEQRPLTRGGRRRFTEVVVGLGQARVLFDAVWHSPLLRAAETAALLQPLCSGPINETPSLAEHPTLERLEALLEGARPAESVAFVGHEPLLSATIGLLLFGAALPSGRDAPFQMKKGAVAYLTGDQPGGFVLRALWPPSTLRARASRAPSDPATTEPE